jgi:hypothetical protein
MSGDVMTYDHISENPDNFTRLFEEQMSLAKDIRSGAVEVDQGLAMSRPYFGAVKTLETDLRARMFQHRIEHSKPRALPDDSERLSSDAAPRTENQ